MSDDTQQKDKSAIITKHQFFFETPLYEPIRQSTLEANYHTGDVDAYSALNNIDTTYTISYYSLENNYPYLDDFACYKLKCKRKSNDLLVFFTYEDDEQIIKIGQLPSLADLQFGKLGKKYNKHLSREDLQLYKKAIGLAAHGVGAGSFVYLRRIFEKLIFETFAKNSTKLAINEDSFINKRMTEKVEVLKEYLPSQMVAMKSIYSILSKGVHELSEKECLTYFPALKLSIELILDQQIEDESRLKRDSEAFKQIQEISQQLAETLSDKKEL